MNTQIIMGIKNRQKKSKIRKMCQYDICIITLRSREEWHLKDDILKFKGLEW